jgi:hypothetical protein
MNTNLSEKLLNQGLIGQDSLHRLEASKQQQTFSLYWELRTILYLGVLLLTGGLGVLVYKNIDTIGHTAILIFIGLVSSAGFIYCFKTARPFSMGRTASPNSFFDYVLLLACLSFVIFIGYLQYQYHFFGLRYGLASAIPMMLLFFSAYYFDNLGVLSLAVTNLCAWAGITVTPTRILQDNDFNSTNIIVTGLVLGAGLILLGMMSKARDVKAHFAFTYNNFGMHLLFISIIAGMFQFEQLYFLWFLLLLAVVYYFYVMARRNKSFYIMLILTLYGFIGLSTVVMRFLFETIRFDLGSVYLAFLYFIGAGIGLIVFLIRMNKKLKQA